MTRVAVIGASERPGRYSLRALRLLQEKGYSPVPISKTGRDLLGLRGYASLADDPDPVDTVTVYLSPEKQAPVIRDILATHPRRVVFNPGAENPAAAEAIRRAGIQVVEACTLVLLATDQF